MSGGLWDHHPLRQFLPSAPGREAGRRLPSRWDTDACSTNAFCSLYFPAAYYAAAFSRCLATGRDDSA